jgi:hypothetical protein
MGIAKSLTNDLERAVKLWRVPMCQAYALSLRNALEDRFLVTDPRTEDERKNIVKLERVSQIQRQMTKLDVGVDSRQFIDMSGSLLFDGRQAESGRVVPVPNVSVSGGRADAEDVLWTYTGDEDAKRAKMRRYVLRRPEQVNWRVRSPIMMATETTILDYLALRVTKLQFLQSVAIKWSDRRWDARSCPLSADMFRPDGERTDMVVLAPVWMDEAMNILDPNIWGPYEDLIRANYEEYLGRHDVELEKDTEAFVARFQDYLVVLRPGLICGSQEEENQVTAGRLERRFNQNLCRTLHIPFDRSIDTRDDSYHPRVFTDVGAADVTEDVFNLEDADDAWRLTSSFEAATLAEDGWYGTATMSQSTDIPAGLPAFATTRAGEPVFGTKSLQLVDGFAAHRLILPDGNFALRFWVKNVAGTSRVEIVRNTRLKPKQIHMDVPVSRVLSIQHFRESYETVASSIIETTVGEWTEVFISFPLKDHFFVKSEGYPAHEVFIVFSTVDGSTEDTPSIEPEARFDHLTLHLNTEGHDVKIVNSAARSRFPDLLRAFEKTVDLELGFAEDTEFEGRERAGNAFRFDGANTCCVAAHRNAYNLHPTGTNINGWFKVNSADEAANRVLERRGSFTLFQKGTTYLPSYQASVNDRRELTMGWGESGGAASTGFRNQFIHPACHTAAFPPYLTWGDALATERYRVCVADGSKQPREWFSGSDDAVATVGEDTDIGDGKLLWLDVNDPYLTEMGYVDMEDPAAPAAVTLWLYFEWHARRAYALFVPADQVVRHASFSAFLEVTETGNLFLPVPLAANLLDVPPGLGTYSPSPGAYSPHTGALGTPAPWPISPCGWGVSPSQWPQSPTVGWTPWGTPPTFNPLNFAGVVDVDALYAVGPLFVDGRIVFDRWWNLDLNADRSGVEVRLNGVLVARGAGGDFNVKDGKECDEPLYIATANPDDTNTGAPISAWSFKIAQRKLSDEAIQAVFQAEAINFNELQYGIWGQYLDFDRDRQFDYFQETMTDFSLEMKWIDPVPSPLAPAFGPFPNDLTKIFGKVDVSVADEVTISPQLDRNRDVVDDDFDEAYLKELIDVQTLGFSDGLLFWDFLTDRNNIANSITQRVYDPACQGYKNETLSYRDWLNGHITEEFNSVKAITDPVPTLTDLGVTSPDPPNPPSYGDDDTELLMTGVKGWFGYDELMGYRDSLAKLDKEGMVFNYLQIEFRFRADRAVLERVLLDFADSYAQIFADDYAGHRLKRSSEG